MKNITNLLPYLVLLSCLLVLNVVPVDAIDFKGEDDYITMNNIENYVESNIEYEFHWHPQGVYKTLRTMKGDCTDKALLKCYYARKEGLKCRTVHGYVDNKVKHDWVEYKINNSWQSNECDYYINCKKVGAGIW